ncbi:MAG TPA: hypothetical protein VIJ49_10770 [Aestuariivirga sp.]
MSELNVAVPASLDEVLGAVKETARGRWFLESYEARLRGAETARLLQAINKLESHVLTQAQGGHDAEIVKHAREAISAARRDIGALDPTVTGLSTEAKLFAQLAEKARSAFNDAPPVGQSVSRALQLMGELEQQLSDPQADATSSVVNLAAKPAQFFKQDEAIFEPAPKQAPPALAVTPEVHPEVSARGAKLVVQRLGAPIALEKRAVIELQPQPIAAAPIPTPAPAPTPTPATAAAVVETPNKSRIIVIRRKADEMANLPLLDQNEKSDNIQQSPSDAA